jgi:hypothetical protein
MLNKLLFLSLILGTSGLFRFVAPQVGVSIGQVTLVLFVLNSLYLVAKADHAIPMLLHRGMGRWLCLLLLWPLATVVYAPSIAFREIGLQFYFFSLFFSTVVYIRLNGLPTFYRMLTISLVITLIGMPLSVMAPGYFEDATMAADARLDQLGRPIGFFLQPNRLAFCLCWIFIAWYALWPRKSASREVVAIIAFLGAELLTGSRGGVLVATGIVVVLLSHNWLTRLIRGRLIYTGVLLLFCLAAGIVGLRAYLGTLSDAGNRRHGDLIDRMEGMVDFRFSPEGSLADDVSLEHRISTQEAYLHYVLEEPVFGRGLGSNGNYLETGRISLSAHSEALTRAFEYGIFYPIAMWLAVGSLYKKRQRKAVEQGLGTNAVTQFCVAFAAIFGYASVMEEGRVFCIVLGLFYSIVHYPIFLFHLDENTGSYGAPLTRAEIREQRGTALVDRDAHTPAVVDAP